MKFTFMVMMWAHLSLATSYISPSNQEASLHYQHSVIFKSKKKPQETDVKRAIEKQIAYALGGMHSQKIKATPKFDHSIKITEVVSSTNINEWKATYEFTGTIILPKNSGETYSFILPIRPDSIYRQSEVKNEWGQKKYPCTHKHYQSESEFSYFWDPFNKGCKLRAGIHYETVYGSLSYPLKKTEIKHYPDYKQLIKNNQIPISVFFGLNKNGNIKNPYISLDYQARAYRDFVKKLKNSGFKNNKRRGRNKFKNGLIETFTRYSKIHGRITVKTFFGVASESDYRNQNFYNKLHQAFKESTVIIYNGHSGLGSALSLETIEEESGRKLSIDSDQYQILFVNGCKSYSYYNESFANLKNRKNIDIITNGIESIFKDNASKTFKLIEKITLWADSNYEVSYEQLMSELDHQDIPGVNIYR
ncbi:MAG: hypothetical protein CL678_02810 [Bdellovibrionaceae bacterium]|nr:hypothetical protein [Pseudobdellovibrionaceae bacterium]|tara:strand:- start:3371 stop:4627 length:1257 start_codon:yes stop_codon:yes gene_type:complete